MENHLSVFVPADLPAFETIMDRCLADNRPIVVIYPDGSEQLVEPYGLSAQRL